MKNSLVGFVALFISSILFGSYGLWIRILNVELTAYQQIAFRYALGALLLFVFLGLRREKIAVSKIIGWHLGIFSLTVPVSFIFFVSSMINTKISVATVGFYLGTIIVSFILGSVVFKEKIMVITFIDFVLAIIGLFLFLYPISLSTLNWGFLMGVASGICWGIGSVFKKSLQGKVSRLWLLTILSVASVIVTLPFVLAGTHPVPATLNAETLIALVILTVTALGAEYLTIVGFQNYDLNWGSIILSGEIVFAGLIGYLFFRETLTPSEKLGLAFVLAAMTLPQMSLLVKKKTH